MCIDTYAYLYLYTHIMQCVIWLLILPILQLDNVRLHTVAPYTQYSEAAHDAMKTMLAILVMLPMTMLVPTTIRMAMPMIMQMMMSIFMVLIATLLVMMVRLLMLRIAMLLISDGNDDAEDDFVAMRVRLCSPIYLHRTQHL